MLLVGDLLGCERVIGVKKIWVGCDFLIDCFEYIIEVLVVWYVK